MEFIILLASAAVAFAAFCVWLIVRVVNRRERWAVVTLIVLAIGAVVLWLSLGLIGDLITEYRLFPIG